MNVEIISKLNIGHSEVAMRADGIVQVVASDRDYSKKDIKEIHAAVSQLSESKKVLMLLVASKYTSVDRDARHFLSTSEAGQYSIAESYVIKSLAQRMLMNFLITVQKTPVPVKFFNDHETAVRWLKTHQPILVNDDFEDDGSFGG